MLLPETPDWDWLHDEAAQTHWEWEALGRAACVMFWIPRELETLPGFTTNIELGLCAALRPDRIVVGCPPSAPKTAYVRRLCAQLPKAMRAFGCSAPGSAPVADTLEATVALAAKVANDPGRSLMASQTLPP